MMIDDQFKRLRSELCYSDLYDRFTVEEGRRWYSCGISEDHALVKTSKAKSKEDLMVEIFSPTILYFFKGERYLNKAKTIQEWMDRDRRRDQKFENAQPPAGLSCFYCGSAMGVINKTLHTEVDPSKDRVLFFFECPNCHKRRGVWDNGGEWKLKPILCSKCRTEMKSKDVRQGNKIITKYSCPNCHYHQEEVLDLDEKPKQPKVDPHFERDRQKFCLSEKEGIEYLSAKGRMEQLSNLFKEIEGEKKTKDILIKVKKLSIVELEKLLIPALKKDDYLKLDFSKPEIAKDVIINFTIQDNKVGRHEYDSRINLQKLIKKTLEDTNWRLMSEGVDYRLGILSGRLRGYEKEDDLIRIGENL